MKQLQKLVHRLKAKVKKASVNPRFIHHEWFLTYHLEIVEKIALELCRYYPEANKDLVVLLVWLHDYGKIIRYDNQHEATITLGRKMLLTLGFSETFVEKIMTYIRVFDEKVSLNHAPIEVKIVSSSDAASHLIGPFFAVYWKEHHQKTCEELMEENRRKARIDWERKIVLPQVKQAFRARYTLLLERSGKFPKSYLS